MFQIFFDSIQEGDWFQSLSPSLKDATLLPFPTKKQLTEYPKALQESLSFDRPDIILCHDFNPILVVERTIEVPSGHNVGQRFARLVAAAKEGIPVIYFGPYAAYKHGGKTQGPRYMNLRLFYALKKMSEIYSTYVSTINWPVDKDYEIIRTPEKDSVIIDFLKVFFEQYKQEKLKELNAFLINSEFEKKRELERAHFIKTEVKKPEQYDSTPPSLKICETKDLASRFEGEGFNRLKKENVLYEVGMKYVRSDPYTGMALLYSFLYCGGLTKHIRHLVLFFPNISYKLWSEAASNGNRKDIRLYRLAADAIVFVKKLRLSGEF